MVRIPIGERRLGRRAVKARVVRRAAIVEEGSVIMT
jgi:hypothetical protein